jgi:hypothetical protein
LHPAENRALRELWAISGAWERRWRDLGIELGDREPALSEALLDGAMQASYLRADLRAVMRERDLHGEALAGMAGHVTTAGPLPLDAALEVNQAARQAVLYAAHVATLLPYVRHLAEADGDLELAGALDAHERPVALATRAVRDVAIALGERPQDAIQPVRHGVVGKAGARAAWAVGAFGEWADRRIGRLKQD